MSGDLDRRHTAKIEALAARAHGFGYPIRFSGREDEDRVRRRLFKRFQQGVEGFFGQHVHFIDDVHFVARFVRPEADLFTQITDLVDPSVRGRVDLDQVELAPLGYADADPAVIARTGGRIFVQAVDRFGEDARRACLARAARTGEEVRVRQAPVAQRVSQRKGHVFLADHLFECL